MAQQHLFVVEDELFALPSLKQRKPKVCGESNSYGGGVDDRLTAKIVDLPHPRTGDPRKFMILGGNVLEIQVAKPRGSELASVFIDQSVQEEGALYMASRIDPLFLLLPVLTKHARKWCPLEQALAEAGQRDLRGLHHLDARKLCDVNDRLGPDELLIRLNEDSVLKWLTAKVERSSTRISQLATESTKVNDGNLPPCSLARKRGSAQGFNLIATTDDEDRRKELEAEGRHQALEAVCEYINEEWGRKLAEKFSTERSLMFGGKSSSTKKRKATWEGSSEVDKHLELSHGIGDTKINDFCAFDMAEETTKRRAADTVTSKEGASAAPGTKPKQAMTSGQRSLSKVNKKGMKSISSFFNR